MKSYLDIVKGRSNPGILIFDPDDHLAYSNKEALDFLPGLRKRVIPPEILELCARVRRGPGERDAQETGPYFLVIDTASGFPFSLRAFPIEDRRAAKMMSYVMVLVEKVLDRHPADVDFDKIKADFELTDRETEVLKLVSEGRPNRDIAASLFISEYTVKDHIKKILDKMNLDSRSEIIASLLQPRKKGP
jgi:DNA-binding CsgD family transcriptional regulator